MVNMLVRALKIVCNKTFPYQICFYILNFVWTMFSCFGILFEMLGPETPLPPKNHLLVPEQFAIKYVLNFNWEAARGRKRILLPFS